MFVEYKDKTQKIMVPVSKFPVVSLAFPIYQPCGIKIGRTKSTDLTDLEWMFIRSEHAGRLEDFKNETSKQGAIALHNPVRFHHNSFMRLVAKKATTTASPVTWWRVHPVAHPSVM